MSKELTKKEEAALAEINELNAGFGQEVVDADDLVLDKLNLMQSLSELVTDEKFKVGDIVNTQTMEKYADYSSTVDLVPFRLEKFIYVIKQDGGSGELVNVEPYSAGFIREYEEGGDKFKRVLNYRVYFVKEVGGLPIVIDFRSSSAKVGKQIATHMRVTTVRAGKNPASKILKIGSVKTKNDHGTFAVLTMSVGEDTPIELQKEALEWYKSLNDKPAKVEETEYAAKGVEEKELSF